jgi:hypothetical protein
VLCCKAFLASLDSRGEDRGSRLRIQVFGFHLLSLLSPGSSASFDENDDDDDSREKEEGSVILTAFASVARSYKTKKKTENREKKRLLQPLNTSDDASPLTPPLSILLTPGETRKGESAAVHLPNTLSSMCRKMG